MGTTLRHQDIFRRTHWRVGYSATEVDAFVSRAEIALRSVAPRLRAYDVFRHTFTHVRGEPGYRMPDVDSYLEDVEHRLEHHEKFITTAVHRMRSEGLSGRSALIRSVRRRLLRRFGVEVIPGRPASPGTRQIQLSAD
jgi:DivIVA domain-containing protein